ncbi:type II secretion system protein [Fusibacter sp. JL216-2]|uniref:type II secretion system protein n=1 Tax=Fusibacter sp. JL216-2 TaxID=3071453 RepID=UPI003D338432
MPVKNKLKSKAGFTLLELLIVISIMSLVMVPAYMAMFRGFDIFSNESKYQEVLADAHLFYEEVNTRIRMADYDDVKKYNNISEITDLENLNQTGLTNNTTILRIKDILYYVKDSKLYKYSNDTENELCDSVVSLVVDKSNDNDVSVGIELTINVDGRQETISTSISKRY